MSTDGIQNFSGDAELIDGVLRDNDSEEDTYPIDQDNDEVVASDDDDDDDDEDNSVVELGMEKTLDDDVFNDDDAPPSLEDLKAKATREWEREIGSVEIIDDPVRMYLREIGRVDLLRAVEERDLARKFEAKRYVENLEEEFSENTPFPKARDVVIEMMDKVSESEEIIKAILVSKEVPFDGTLPDLMANPDIRSALDGIFQDESLEQISAILSELTDQDPPDFDTLKEMIKQASINSRLLPDDIFKVITGSPSLSDLKAISQKIVYLTKCSLTNCYIDSIWKELNKEAMMHNNIYLKRIYVWLLALPKNI